MKKIILITSLIITIIITILIFVYINYKTKILASPNITSSQTCGNGIIDYYEDWYNSINKTKCLDDVPIPKEACCTFKCEDLSTEDMNYFCWNKTDSNNANSNSLMYRCDCLSENPYSTGSYYHQVVWDIADGTEAPTNCSDGKELICYYEEIPDYVITNPIDNGLIIGCDDPNKECRYEITPEYGKKWRMLIRYAEKFRECLENKTVECIQNCLTSAGPDYDLFQKCEENCSEIAMIICNSSIPQPPTQTYNLINEEANCSYLGLFKGEEQKVFTYDGYCDDDPKVCNKQPKWKNYTSMYRDATFLELGGGYIKGEPDLFKPNNCYISECSSFYSCPYNTDLPPLSITGYAISNTTCKPTEIMEVHIAASIDDSDLEESSKIFDYYSKAKLYAIIKLGNGNYYLGNKKFPGDEKLPNKAKIDTNGDGEADTYVSLKKIPSCADAEYTFEWRDLKVEEKITFFLNDDYVVNNKNIWWLEPNISKYPENSNYKIVDPKHLDEDVGTRRYVVAVFGGPQGDQVSYGISYDNFRDKGKIPISLSRKGRVSYPEFPTQTNNFINTMKIFHESPLSGFGSTDIECKKILKTDCADIQIATAYHTGILPSVLCSNYGASSLGMMSGGITEKRTDWAGLYQLRSEEEIPILVTSFKSNSVITTTHDTDSSSSKKLLVYTFDNETNNLSISYIKLNGLTKIIETRGIYYKDNKIYLADGIGSGPENPDYIYVFELKSSGDEADLVLTIPMKSPVTGNKDDVDPIDIEVDEIGNIYVLIEDYCSIYKFDSKGNPVPFTSKHQSILTNAIFLNDNSSYNPKLAHDSECDYIQKYRRPGEIGVIDPVDMTYYKGKLYILAGRGGEIRVFDKDTGEFIKKTSKYLSTDKFAKRGEKIYSINRLFVYILDPDLNSFDTPVAKFGNLDTKKYLDFITDKILFINNPPNGFYLYNLNSKEIIKTKSTKYSFYKVKYDKTTGIIPIEKVIIPIGAGPNELHPGDLIVFGKGQGSNSFHHTEAFYRDRNVQTLYTLNEEDCNSFAETNCKNYGGVIEYKTGIKEISYNSKSKECTFECAKGNGYLDINDVRYCSLCSGYLGLTGSVRYSDISNDNYFINGETFVIRKWKALP